MSDFILNITSSHVDIFSSAFRILLSIICGAIIGLEREYRKQPAGLRTHILIALGSSLLMLLSIYIPQQYSNFQNGDPSRIAAQVVTGIGFLGGGAILKLGTNVKGLTTAASIWITSAIGLALGAGMYFESLISTLFTIIVLFVLEFFERKYFHGERTKVISLYFEHNKIKISELYNICDSFKIHVLSTDSEYSIKKGSCKIVLFAKVPTSIDVLQLQKEFCKINSIEKVLIKEHIGIAK